uniref:Uncharacterized protein n=1 Tax=Chenopodium quinoa TaxID=63459 RepID=A0A803KQH8_CHEQI
MLFSSSLLEGNVVLDVAACLRENFKGNTPLHVAAEVGNFGIVELLYDHLSDERPMPWRVQNSKGDTPLHVALTHDNVKIARFLLEKDSDLALIVNNSNEAPLHLAIKQHVNYSESESIMAKVKNPINEGGADLTIESAPQENMSSMIELLVEKASKVTCWPDANGLTPLHRVASLITPYNILFTVFILDRCPQSAEVCDNSGKSIIHLLINKITNYPDAKNLLNIEEIYALRNYQDNQGNTPLHIAAQNVDSVMVRVLLESSAKLNINNADGISAACIIQQQDMLQILRKRQLTIGEIEAVDTANVTFLTERMRTLGIEKKNLLSKDTEGRNILHRLMRIRKESHVNPEDFVNFIELALEIFPSLISQADKNGDTPIHILVRNSPNTRIYVASRVEDNKQYNHSDEGTGDSDRLPYGCVVLTLKESNILSLCLKKCNESILRIEDEAKHKGHCFDSPWLVQNVEGNTPLHESLKSDENIKLVELLLNYNKESISVTNKDNETPLHLFATRIVGK